MSKAKELIGIINEGKTRLSDYYDNMPLFMREQLPVFLKVLGIKQRPVMTPSGNSKVFLGFDIQNVDVDVYFEFIRNKMFVDVYVSDPPDDEHYEFPLNHDIGKAFKYIAKNVKGMMTFV